MVDLAGQLSAAASQGVDHVTVLMGANDLCTSSASAMTSVSTFTSQWLTLTHAAASTNNEVAAASDLPRRATYRGGPPAAAG